MKLFASKFNIVFIILFMISTPALSGTLHIWTDENGVTHMTNQPPPPDNEQHEKINYKNPKNTYRPSRDNFKYIKIKEAEQNENIRRLKLERELEREFEERESDREKREQKRELDEAKREYEYHEKERESYRENYHDAYSLKYKRYWRDKMKEADEAYSKYRKLKNEYGNKN